MTMRKYVNLRGQECEVAYTVEAADYSVGISEGIGDYEVTDENGKPILDLTPAEQADIEKIGNQAVMDGDHCEGPDDWRDE